MRGERVVERIEWTEGQPQMSKQRKSKFRTEEKQTTNRGRADQGPMADGWKVTDRINQTKDTIG